MSEVSESEMNIQVSTDVSIWNDDIENFFSIPKPVAPRKTNKRAPTSHCLLTSQEVIDEKRKMKEKKEKKTLTTKTTKKVSP